MSDPVVIDNGSGMIKAGISGEEAPSVQFPVIIGRPKNQNLMGANEKEYLVGDDALAKKDMMTLTHPVQYGIVKNWEDMEKVWTHCFTEQLRVESNESPVMLTEAPMNPKKNRENMTTAMFETFQVPSFYVSIQAVLSLYASGKTTGIVVDSGDGVTHTVPIFEGFFLPAAVGRVNLAGSVLTERMSKLLLEVNCTLTSAAELELVREMKERLCYVALDYQAELKAYQESSEKQKTFDLPDGTQVTVGDQMFRCPEALFKPMEVGMDVAGIQELTNSSIQNCDIDVRKTMYQNIVMSGGSTMYEGIDARLQKEVQNLAPSAIKAKVIADATRKYQVWIGGSILSSLATFQQCWISQEDYNEVGPSIVHRKCF